MSSAFIPFRPSSTITTFSKWLSSSMKARVFENKTRKNNKSNSATVVSSIFHIYVSFSSVEKILTKVD